MKKIECASSTFLHTMDITEIIVDKEKATLHELFFGARYPLKIQQLRCCFKLYLRATNSKLTDRDVQYYGFKSLYHFKLVYARVIIFNLSKTDYTFEEIVRWIKKRIRVMHPGTTIPENHFCFYEFLIALPLPALISLGW